MVDSDNQYSAAYAGQIGTLFGNLSTLETMLRMALLLLDTPRDQRLRLETSSPLDELSVSDEVPETWLNRHRNLDGLIADYNDRAKSNGFGVVADAEIYDLRTALAHGLAWASEEGGVMSLVRFRTVAAGVVRVVSKYKMTDEWFAEQRQRTYVAIRIVGVCVNTLREDVACTEKPAG